MSKDRFEYLLKLFTGKEGNRAFDIVIGEIEANKFDKDFIEFLTMISRQFFTTFESPEVVRRLTACVHNTALDKYNRSAALALLIPFECGRSVLESLSPTTRCYLSYPWTHPMVKLSSDIFPRTALASLLELAFVDGVEPFMHLLDNIEESRRSLGQSYDCYGEFIKTCIAEDPTFDKAYMFMQCFVQKEADEIRKPDSDESKFLIKLMTDGDTAQ